MATFAHASHNDLPSTGQQPLDCCNKMFIQLSFQGAQTILLNSQKTLVLNSGYFEMFLSFYLSSLACYQKKLLIYL
tara:strand:+ start:69 stop:296 length:228 start_codon:yes stop_codon:yes gene_type:complete